MERTTGYYNTFVVKIWRDEVEGAIRGYIQHASSREHTYFLSLESMADFIVSHLGPPPSDSVTEDEMQGESALITEDFDMGQDE